AFTVNGRSLEDYFPRAALQKAARQPLQTAGFEKRMDVIARIHGGGVSAQAGALRHGVARALVDADPSLRVELKRRGYLSRDARESGEMLEAALAAGVAAAGGHALLGGVLPTPGAALLLRRFELDLAAVVSASHNPYRDNGIKFFGPDGTKLGHEQESEIERLVAAAEAEAANGRVRELHGAGGDYLRE